MADQQHRFTGTPGGAPSQEGHHMADTTNQRHYISYATNGVDDWKDPLGANQKIIAGDITLTKADHGRVIVVDASGSPDNITITLPQTSTEDIPVNFTCTIFRKNGTVALATEGGETLYAPGTSISSQYQSCVVWRHETGSPASWAATGALE